MNTQTNNQKTVGVSAGSLTTAQAYGVTHMHELNNELPPLGVKAAEQTIEYYRFNSDNGKVYAMVFTPTKPVRETLSSMLQKVSDVTESIMTYLKGITNMKVKTLYKKVKMFFSPEGELLQIAVTCRQTARKLLAQGFQLRQFPIAITTL